ncbi:MAG: RNA methyltransferase [Simkania negevensis]|nr:RNA methyltransferase [Simkania negevensis]
MSNLKVKHLLRLRERKERDLTKTFLIEGYRELLRATEGKVSIEALFVSPVHFLGKNEMALVNTIVSQGAELFYLEEKVFAKVSYRDRPDGLMAIAKNLSPTLATFISLPHKNTSPFYLVAEGIEKPGNLGSILRSADAAGVDAFFLCDQCTDLYNPNTVRSSVGTLFTLPTFETSSEEMIGYLKKRKIQIISSTPDAAKTLWEIDGKNSLAVVVGSEQLGLSKKWLNAADLLVKIPMQGKADSLNVAAASTLLLYEVLRQRFNQTVG